MKLNKVIVLGSGALKIAQAGEFDYSGSQALKALKEEGIKTVLINPNIATIQTSDVLADMVYFLPVTPYFVEQIIEKEKPDGILLSFGGQTALNCGVELFEKGVFKKHNVEVLGTPIRAIMLSEDRQKFADHLHTIDVATPLSQATNSVKEAVKIAEKIGYPIMIRAAYTMGGQKSGVAFNKKELMEIAGTALSFSSQILVEQYLHHFKEVEYEVVRDKYDNCVTVCNMENFDPLGIHTGESIVVAPSQTLTNLEYHTLRKKSIEIVRSLGIVGECNVQFALNPHPEGEIDFYVIELNARLSRSSALASKATGYPLAYVAAKLALGKSLIQIQNQVTQVTQSFFEPALDYLVVKVPRWDLQKFSKVEEKIGSSMKSVGEVMAIGRTFEEAVQKAMRMLDIGAQGVTENTFTSDRELDHYIKTPTPRRIFAICEALRRGKMVNELYDITGIDPWFLYRLKEIVRVEEHARRGGLDQEIMQSLKEHGFSDKKIAQLKKKTENEIRELRKKWQIVPSIFQMDTLAGEIPAKTNYLYLTYHGNHNDVKPLGKTGVIVLGSGPYRIGSSVEFDWGCVNTAQNLKKYHKKSIIINCNPETVSTDYDISDRLYFEQLTFEAVADIYDFEQSEGLVISVGGQTPNNLAQPLENYGVPILGTQAKDIDRAEDRSKFSELLDELNVLQPAWNRFSVLRKADQFAEKVGYPVLIRPSYVLSGSAMVVARNHEDLFTYVKKNAYLSNEYPVTVSKFIEEAKEIELDAVAQDGEIQVYAISEHVEHAGVHSGDATIMYPPQKIYLHSEKKITEIARKLARALHITGPFNIQFMAKENDVYVIELNVRASRTLPFISKSTGVNFAAVFVDSLYRKSKPKEIPYPDYVVVKSPQFSFARLEGADPVLHVEMASTGEAACFGDNVEIAFLKAEYSVGGIRPKKGIFISLGGEDNKVRFLDSILRLKKFNLPLYATEKTAKFMKANGVEAKTLHKISEKRSPNILTYFEAGKIDLAINFSDYSVQNTVQDGYFIRRAAVDHNIYLVTNRQKAELLIKALVERKDKDLQVKSWHEYV